MTILLTSLLVFPVIVGAVALHVTALQVVAVVFNAWPQPTSSAAPKPASRPCGRSRRAW